MKIKTSPYRNTQAVLWLALILLMGMGAIAEAAQTFDSGSDGSDGALDFTWAIPSSGTRTIVFDPDDPSTFDPANPTRRLDVDNDNVFHFTTITIPGNVTVHLTAPKLNWAPVYWLATGNVEIQYPGVLALNGGPGHEAAFSGEGHFPSVPGPGGFPGGLGASILNFSQAGFGPGAGAPAPCNGCRGGGAGHVNKGGDNHASGGTQYGSPFLLPLVGGSGGAGGGNSVLAPLSSSGGGGAGGGAILIATSGEIILNGIIEAVGGAGGGSQGGGSGGSIRLIAKTIRNLPSTVRWINVNGGSLGGSGGRIRLESFNNKYQGRFFPENRSDTVRIGGLVPTTPFLPSDPRVPGWPTIHVVSVNGLAVSQEPAASFAMPDASVPTSDPVPVVFKTKHIPIGAALTFHLISPDAGVIKVSPTFSAGVEADATWTAQVPFPIGFTRAYLQATWAKPTP